MKKIIAWVVCTFVTFGAVGQTHELFVKLDQLSAYSADFEETARSTKRNDKVLTALDYALGYNYFLNPTTYIGASLGMVPRKSTFLSESVQGTERIESERVQKETRYTFGGHVGRLFQINKFRLYTEGGVHFRMYRKVQNVLTSNNYDNASNVFLRSGVQTQDMANAHEYLIRLSQGVYYSFFKGISLGVDLPVLFSLYSKNGTNSTRNVTTSGGVITETTTKANEVLTSYSFRISPTLGIRYTFK